jgi:predicted nucleic acid-binding protein
MAEIEKPIKMGYKASEVDLIELAKIIETEELSAKEIVEAKKISKKHNIGTGEAEAAILFKRGNFDAVIVADIRAERKLRELKVNALDLVDVSFVVAKRGIMNPREFAKKLYEKAHYRTQRIRDILGR